jgi:hypothetical protein
MCSSRMYLCRYLLLCVAEQTCHRHLIEKGKSIRQGSSSPQRYGGQLFVINALT